MSPRIFATCDLGPALSRVQAAGAILEVHPEDAPPSRARLVEVITAGVDGLITTLRDPIDAELLAMGAPSLKVVAQCAVGLDNVDVEAAHRLGVAVVHTPDVLTGATAEFAVFMLGALARKLRASEALVREGGWWGWHPSKPFLGRSVSGMTVGVVGLGRIGRAFAARCAALDVELLLCDPRHEDEALRAALQLQMDTLAGLGTHCRRTVRFTTLDELLRCSDAVSVHVPLTAETRGLIDGPALSLMKPDALLINTARGPVVDEAALAQALEARLLGGVALDVFESEPLALDSPLLSPALAERVRVFHHFGSGTHETRLSADPHVGMAGRCVTGLLAALGLEGDVSEMSWVLRPDGQRGA